MIFIDDCLYIFISSKEILSFLRAYARAYYVFLFSSITSITNSVYYHIYRRLYSDRRCDRRVIVVIEERFFNVKIGDFSHKFTIKRGHSEGLYPIISKRLHDDVLHISKKPLRGELSGFLSICQAEASCISPKEY